MLRLRPAFRAARTEGEVGDVQPVLAQDRSDASDHARNVLVADRDQRSMQRSLDVDAIVAQQPRRVAMQHRCGRARVAARSAGRVQRQLQHRARAARDELLLVLLDANAAILRDRRRVDAVDRIAVRVGVGEDARNRGVADQLGLALRDAAVVGEMNALEMRRARRRMAEEVSQPLAPSRCTARSRCTPRA